MFSAFWGHSLLLKSNSKPLKFMQRLPKPANPVEGKSFPATERLLLIQDHWSSPRSLILKSLLVFAPAKFMDKNKLGKKIKETAPAAVLQNKKKNIMKHLQSD